jgi:hypothetical protein
MFSGCSMIRTSRRTFRHDPICQENKRRWFSCQAHNRGSKRSKALLRAIGEGHTSSGINVSKGFKRLNHCLAAESASCSVMVVAVTPDSVSSSVLIFLKYATRASVC